MRQAKGSVTVFLALSAVLIFALFCTCLESARAICTDALMKTAADSAIRSVFAAYQGDVKREYGILLCRGRTAWNSCWQEEAGRYAEKYLEPGAGDANEEADRIGVCDLSAAAIDAVYITEGEGRVFADTVTNYMKSAGLAILLKEALERLGIYSEEEGFQFADTLKKMLGDSDSSPESILDSYKDIQSQALELQTPPPSGNDTPPGSGSGQTAPTEESSAKEMKADLLEQIKAIRENGLIAVLTGSESLSEYAWNTDPTLPSLLPAAEKAAHSDYPSASVSLLNHFLMGEYLLHRMGNYVSRKTGGSQYETEYVLTGKSSDKAAFESVAGQILLIRMGFNTAYLITDAQKLAQAEMLAAAILSVLALPQLTVVLKWLLVAAWALAESIVDVKTLLKGKKIPLLKNEANWKLKALSLDLSAGEGSSRGLGYEDYLRLLFYLGDVREQSYRMMDVMQKRLRLKLPAFQMREYMVYAALSLTVTTSYLYIQTPLLRLISGGKGRRYHRQSWYAYERR
ncbi:MAG: hypothetical protein J5496_05770 [Lachnospiraceae bacterium]|nr:hypothetical protein [Lachnospiraceae bacterium]